MNTVLVVIGALALAYLVWYWCNRSKKGGNRDGWLTVVPEGADIVSANNRDFQLNAWSKNWRLAKEGAFRFRADSSNGLVIGLQTCSVTADNWSDQGEGYAIVLDNGDSDRPLSFVTRLPYLTLPTDGSKQNQGFRFRNGWYWAQYKGGLISCGLGTELGQDVIVTGRPHAPLDIRFFGFGCRNARTGLANEEGRQLARISQIEIFEGK